MDQATHNKIVSFIWGIADDVLRDLFKRGKYPDVILPMCVLRRLDAVLEPTKKAVLETKKMLDDLGMTEHRVALCEAAKQSFYNTSRFTLRDLKSRGSQQQLRQDFEAYLDGFSSNIQDILENFKFRNQIPTLSKADMLIKGENAEHIIGGAEYSTLFNDAFRAQEFDFMLSNPPYGKSWKKDLEAMGGKDGMRDPRFRVAHNDEFDYSLVTRSSDGQMLFLANMVSKMNHKTPLGSRVAEVHNGSSLFTGDAGQGESNIRRWIIENDWLEAIVALPLNLFYNTGIATYIWVLSNRKPGHRKGKVQLIDATQWFKPLRKNLGKKNCELSEEDIRRICDTFLAFEETEQSKIFPNEHFGYWKVIVERPLRLHSRLSIQAIESLRFSSGDEETRCQLYEEFGDALFKDFGGIKALLGKRLTEWGNGDQEDDTEEGMPARNRLPEGKKKKLLNPRTWERDARLVETALALRQELGEDLFEDHNVFRTSVKDTLEKLGRKVAAADLKIIFRAVSRREEAAPPVIAKVHKKGKIVPDPLRGRYKAKVDGKTCVMEYEPDSDLRDTEQVPLLESGGIEAFIRREVLPYTPDAWIKEEATKIGYEISFTRHFYRPTPLRTLKEIRADILAVEKEAEGLLDGLLKTKDGRGS
jgi:type I restriction enzyme M protein